MSNTEQWAEVKDFEGKYAVSTHGRVKSLARNVCRLSGTFCEDVPEIVMRQFDHYKGHKYIFLYFKNVRKKRFVHRLVAEAFIPNPDNLPIVNHEDLNKKNNNITNLKWVTESENTQHYYDKRPEGDDQNF